MEKEIVETRRSPLDIEGLKKGDVITADELLKIVGHPAGTEKYAFGLLGLREKIMADKAAMGDPVTVRVCKGNLEVLSDELSSQYNDKRFKVNMAKMLTSHGRLMQVDDSEFAASTKKLHDKRLNKNGRTIQGALLGRSGKLELEPYKNKTQLPAAEKK